MSGPERITVRPRVLHLDHTSAAGGAELALVRMLRAPRDWTAAVSVPPNARGGVFVDLAGRVSVRVTGVTQPAGVSTGGVLAALTAGARLAVQALATRLDPAFRTADIIDANTSRAAAYGALAARLSGVRLVVHLRDLVSAESLGGFGFAMMSRIVLPCADGVIANSQTTLDSALPFLRARAVTAVIPSASGLQRSAAPSHSGPLRVGMLARIDPWKGQDLLIRAFAAAFPEGEATLELAGGAPFGHEGFASELAATAARLGIADRVKLLGHVDDVDELLSRWDVAVQASLRPEPLGQNVLQYLAAGCATVVADEGGPAEWVTDGANGLRFTPRDEASLSSVLRRLSEDDELRGALATAGPQTPGLLSDAEVAESHAEFYRRVVGA